MLKLVKTYQLVEEQPQPLPGNYVSLEDFQQLYQYVMELERKIKETPFKMTDKKGGISNVQSNANGGKQSNYANDGNVAKQQ